MFISEPEQEESLLNVMPLSYESCDAKNEGLKDCLRYLEWVVSKEFRRESIVGFTHWSWFFFRFFLPFLSCIDNCKMVVVAAISSKHIFLKGK